MPMLNDITSISMDMSLLHVMIVEKKSSLLKNIKRRAVQLGQIKRGFNVSSATKHLDTK